MDCPPGREGRQGHLHTGCSLTGQQVAGGNYLAVRAGSQPPLDEGVQVGEVGHHLEAGLWDQNVG